MGRLELRKKLIEERRPSSWAIIAFILIALLNALFWYASCDRLISLVLSAVTLLMFVGGVLLSELRFREREDKSPLFLYALICSGLVFMGVFTPFTVPDEIYHFNATYCASDALMGYGYQADPLPMRRVDANLVNELSATVEASNYDAVMRGLSEVTASSEMTEMSTGSSLDPSANLPQLRLVGALGITVARLLNLGPYYLLYLGRFCNLAFFIVCAYLAFKIMPVGKNVIAVVSLLPMTQHLAASYSYDVGILCYALLDTALIVRAIFRKDRMGVRECVEIGAVSCLLAPCKVVYSFIVVLLVFVPHERFSSRRQEMLVKLLLVGLPFAVVLLLRFGSFVALSGTGETAGTGLDHRGVETGYFYTLSDVMREPVKFFIMYLRTLDSQGSFYLLSMLGSSLGWLQAEISAPTVIGVALVVIALLSALPSRDDETVMPTPFRVAAAVVFGLCVIAVMASMLLGWTFNTEQTIMGVQGRYFLPLLPVLLLAVRPRSVRIDVSSRALLIGSISALNVLYLVRIFSIALTL
ncbi:DUF2142 domain-containing protein [Thermophilibacter sp.]